MSYFLFIKKLLFIQCCSSFRSNEKSELKTILKFDGLRVERVSEFLFASEKLKPLKPEVPVPLQLLGIDGQHVGRPSVVVNDHSLQGTNPIYNNIIIHK